MGETAMDEMTLPQTASKDAAPKSAGPIGPQGPIDRLFGLSERGTTVGREMMAGATTFAAMAYSIAVNPAIMSNAGMDRADLVSAALTALNVGQIPASILLLAIAHRIERSIWPYIVCGAAAVAAVAGIMVLPAAAVVACAQREHV